MNLKGIHLFFGSYKFMQFLRLIKEKADVLKQSKSEELGPARASDAASTPDTAKASDTADTNVTVNPDGATDPDKADVAKLTDGSSLPADTGAKPSADSADSCNAAETTETVDTRNSRHGS